MRCACVSLASSPSRHRDLLFVSITLFPRNQLLCGVIKVTQFDVFGKTLANGESDAPGKVGTAPTKYHLYPL